MEKDLSREDNDRRLFEDIAAAYAAKDTIQSARVARAHRAKRTMAAIGYARNLLEVGCGAGYAPTYLDGAFETYTGIDYSENLIALAQHFNGSPNRRFVAGNARDFKNDTQFDAIIMIGVLHHMDRPLETLQHLVNILAPGGTLVVNEPQGANPVIRWARAMRMRINNEYSDEQEQYMEAELRSMLEAVGLTSVKITPQGLFSTPFAEVPMPVQAFSRIASNVACRLDGILESTAQPLLRSLSWNLIASGTKQA